MNVIFKSGVILTLIFVSVIGIRFKQNTKSDNSGRWNWIKAYFNSLLSHLLHTTESLRENVLLRRRLRILTSVVLLVFLILIWLILPDLFYYALPCLLFFVVIINMDWVMKLRSNSDFIGEAAITYLIFLSYIIFIVLFIYLVTIYFQNSDTVFLLITS